MKPILFAAVSASGREPARDVVSRFAAATISGLFLISLLSGAAWAGPFTIMTQNMDEGTDYSALLTAQSPLAFLDAVTQTYNQIAATQPAVRATAMAQEIASAQPDVVALQEASIVRTGSPPTSVTSDLLSSLLTTLNSLGQHYAPVIIGTELDAAAPSSRGFNVRLTTQDVILARTDLPASQLAIANAQAHQYTAQLVVPTPVGPIPVTRGYVSADITVDGTTFRFVTTHLDTGQVTPLIQQAQVAELLAVENASGLPVIYAGDFNSSANDMLDPTYPVYGALTAAGLTDVWATAHPGNPGNTCCEDPSLLNADPSLTERIDLGLFSGPFSVDDAELLGVSAADKTPDGLWPSDHAGLLFALSVPEPASLGLFALGLGALGAIRRRLRPSVTAFPGGATRSRSSAGSGSRDIGHRHSSVWRGHAVGWCVADAESATLFQPSFDDAIEKHNVPPGQLTLHADRGAPMKAKATAFLLADLGVTRSHNRPHTSNDNPFSESHFKTLKYQPRFPKRFGCIEDARSFCRQFFDSYNQDHHHAGIGLMTPDQVHYGQVDAVHAARQITLDQAFREYPERFVNKAPTPPDKPTATWINPPTPKVV